MGNTNAIAEKVVVAVRIVSMGNENNIAKKAVVAVGIVNMEK